MRPAAATAREGDAVLLARHFAALFAARHARPLRPLSVEAERSIAADAWPDNNAACAGDGARGAARHRRPARRRDFALPLILHSRVRSPPV